MEPIYFVLILFLGNLFQLSATDCQFPEKLRGRWLSSDRGKWIFLNATAVEGIEVDFPSIKTMDFHCIDQAGSTYLLQAVQDFNFFGTITHFFACWNITQISDDMFKYHSKTDYDTFGDYLFGKADKIATMQETCNRRPNSTELQTFNMIVREASLTDGTVEGVCPAELHDVFNDVTFTRDGVACTNNSMDGSSDDRKLTFDSLSAKNGCLSIVWSGEYLCLYHIETVGVTYLYVWKNVSRSDSNFWCILYSENSPKIAAFTCGFIFALVYSKEYREEENRVLAVATSMFCSANLTEDDPNYYRRGGRGPTEIMFAGIADTDTAQTCTFPAGLKGVWITSENAIFRINSSTIHGYPVNLPGFQTLDLTCDDIHDTKYVLRSIQQTNVFGQTVNIFVCLDIRPSEDSFVYYVGTEYESFLNDALLGSINSTVTIAEVCSRPEPFEGNSAIMLFKNTSSINGIPCPPSTFFTFNSLSVVNGTNTTHCSQSRLEVCEDSTRMRFNINTACGSALAITNADFLCLYYVDNGNRTYLYMETDDRNLLNLQHNIVCAEIIDVNEGLTMTMYAEYCNDLMSAESLLSLQLSSKERCNADNTFAATTIPSTSPGDQSFTIYFVIGGVIVLCIAIAVIIAIIISRQKMCFQCRLQPQAPESGHEFTDIN